MSPTPTASSPPVIVVVTLARLLRQTRQVRVAVDPATHPGVLADPDSLARFVADHDREDGGWRNDHDYCEPDEPRAELLAEPDGRPADLDLRRRGGEPDAPAELVPVDPWPARDRAVRAALLHAPNVARVTRSKLGIYRIECVRSEGLLATLQGLGVKYRATTPGRIPKGGTVIFDRAPESSPRGRG